MRKWLRKYVDPWLPLYAVIPVTAALTINSAIYYGTQWLTADQKHWNMETVLDRNIPTVPEFVSVYYLFFLFCAVTYLVIAGANREEFYRLVFADVFAKLICGICFLVIPTTNVRPVDFGNGFWSEVLRFLYRMDDPVNLFPSIHCLSSWLCWVAVRAEKKLPVWYRMAVGIGAVLICLSTLFTKQHVLADVAAGIGLAEGMHLLVSRTGRTEKLIGILERCTEKIFGTSGRT
ncbi:MAG: phosphatase PAP2 family protein [Clostridiales bacterium]|nr:phosphatase PAP2 family protein [Clostridiales bacterium]